MSGTWPLSRIQPVFPGHTPDIIGKTGHVQDITARCPEYGQFFLALFQTSMSFPGHILDIIVRCSEQGQFILALFWTLRCDVRNVARKNCLYSGQQCAMSRIWPEGKIDVRNRATDVRNMASDVQNMASDVQNRASNVRNRAKKAGHSLNIAQQCPE